MKEKKFNGKTLDEYLEDEISDFEVALSRRLKEIFDFYDENNCKFESGLYISDTDKKHQDELINMCDDLVEDVNHFVDVRIPNTFFNFLGEEKRKLIRERLESIKEEIDEIADNIREAFENYNADAEYYYDELHSHLNSVDEYIEELKNYDIIKGIKGKLKEYIKEDE